MKTKMAKDGHLWCRRQNHLLVRLQSRRQQTSPKFLADVPLYNDNCGPSVVTVSRITFHRFCHLRLRLLQRHPCRSTFTSTGSSTGRHQCRCTSHHWCEKWNDHVTTERNNSTGSGYQNAPNSSSAFRSSADSMDKSHRLSHDLIMVYDQPHRQGLR